MAHTDEYKVVIVGNDIVNDEKVRIVKNGSFAMSGAGVAQAMELGMCDKYGESGAFEYVTAIFLPKPSKHPAVRRYSAVMKKMAHNGVDVLAVFNVDVQFKPLQ